MLYLHVLHLYCKRVNHKAGNRRASIVGGLRIKKPECKCKRTYWRFFIWQAIVRGRPVSTGGLFYFGAQNTAFYFISKKI